MKHHHYQLHALTVLVSIVVILLLSVVMVVSQSGSEDPSINDPYNNESYHNTTFPDEYPYYESEDNFTYPDDGSNETHDNSGPGSENSGPGNNESYEEPRNETPEEINEDPIDESHNNTNDYSDAPDYPDNASTIPEDDYVLENDTFIDDDIYFENNYPPYNDSTQQFEYEHIEEYYEYYNYSTLTEEEQQRLREEEALRRELYETHQASGDYIEGDVFYFDEERERSALHEEIAFEHEIAQVDSVEIIMLEPEIQQELHDTHIDVSFVEIEEAEIYTTLDALLKREIKREYLDDLIDEVDGLSDEELAARIDTLEEELEQAFRAADDSLEEAKRKFEATQEYLIVEKKLGSIELPNKITGQLETVSVITTTLEPATTLEDLSVYEEIPKSIATDVSEIIFFNDNYEVIERDPLIVWQFDSLDEDREVRYGVRKQVDAEQVAQTSTIPIAAVVDIEASPDASDSSVSLIGILTPLFVTMLLVLIVLVTHRHQH